MREIKFRAWVEGEDPKTFEMLYDVQDVYDSKPHYHGGFGDVLKDGESIVMQYTGLKDKNGKEIYEGDIVKMKSYSFQHLDRYNYEVYYKPEEARFKFKNNVKYPHNSDNDSTGFHSFEVIGNIHETPELLK